MPVVRPLTSSAVKQAKCERYIQLRKSVWVPLQRVSRAPAWQRGHCQHHTLTPRARVRCRPHQPQCTRHPACSASHTVAPDPDSLALSPGSQHTSQARGSCSLMFSALLPPRPHESRGCGLGDAEPGDLQTTATELKLRGVYQRQHLSPNLQRGAQVPAPGPGDGPEDATEPRTPDSGSGAMVSSSVSSIGVGGRSLTAGCWAETEGGRRNGWECV